MVRVILPLLSLALLTPATLANNRVVPQDLVRQLGAKSFAEREAAARQLMTLGRTAQDAIRDGCSSDDSEIRFRCERLLPLAGRSDQDRRLSTFLLDSDDRLQPPLGGWSKFRELVGNAPDARDLYMDMYQADGELLELYDKNVGQAVGKIGERASKLQQRLFGKPDQRKPIRVGDVAVLLFVASADPKPITTATASNLFNPLYQNGVQMSLRNSTTGKLVLTAFLRRTQSDLATAQMSVYLARSYALEEFIQTEMKPNFRKLIPKELAKKDVKPETISQAYNLANQLSMPDLIKETIQPAARRLLVREAAGNTTNINSLNQAFSLARSLKLPEAVPLALKIALDRKRPAYMRGTAIMLICQLGERDQILQLEPLLDDTSRLGQITINNLQLLTDVRDVALAVLIEARGGKPGDFGFPYLKLVKLPNVSNISPNCLGFTNDKERQEALQRYREFAKKPQPK